MVQTVITITGSLRCLLIYIYIPYYIYNKEYMKYINFNDANFEAKINYYSSFCNPATNSK